MRISPRAPRRSARTSPPKLWRSGFQKHKSFAVDLVLSEERVRYMQELNISLGVQKTLIPYDRVADMSMARDALKLIEKT
jgi:hypothetical protein